MNFNESYFGGKQLVRSANVQKNHILLLLLIGVLVGWRGGLVVGRRTCDLRVAGSRPGRDAAVQQP